MRQNLRTGSSTRLALLALAATLSMGPSACSRTTGPAASPTASPASATGTAVTEDPKQFQEGLKRAGVALLDVRTSEEFSDGHLEGATNLDWNGGRFEAEAAKLDRHRPVYLYCGVGGRSAKAMAAMERLGFAELHNLAGGVMAWRALGLPLGK